MALKQFTVTMTGSAVQAIVAHTPFKFIRIENEIGNAAVNYGTSAVTTTDYAGTVLANTTTITNAVTIGAFDTLPSNLDEFWFIGTNNQKIHITLIS